MAHSAFVTHWGSFAEVLGCQGTALGRELHRRGARRGKAAPDHEVRVLSEGLPAPLAYLDTAERFVFVNRAYAEWLGQSADQLTGRWLGEVLPESDYALIQPFVRRALRGEPVGYERVISYRSGESRWMDVRYIAKYDDRGGVAGVYAFFIDIQRQKEAEGSLSYLETHDPVTQLLNRRGLIERLPELLAHAAQCEEKAAVLCLDLDRFGIVNDSLGHRAGDALLTVIAERLRAALPPSGLLARVAGDEFVAVLSGLTQATEAERRAGEMLAILGQSVIVAGQEVFPSAGVGISVFPDQGEDAESLLRNASSAMLCAKREGRGGVARFAATSNVIPAGRLALESALHRALRENEFELYYQPKRALSDGRVTGLEALLRWRCPGRGIVAPEVFLDVAEEMDLMRPIGVWVIHTAVRQARAWRDQGWPRLPIAVNLSARQFTQGDLAERVGQTIESFGLDATDLEFEITETALFAGGGASASAFRALKALETRIAIDDFGTGYSNLNRLKLLAADTLKIDKSFVQQIGQDDDYAAIVVAIIALAKSLKLKVVAEGVETAAQLLFLEQHGCDEYQGHFFCPALPARALQGRLGVVTRMS